jgi:hypothetical protein
VADVSRGFKKPNSPRITLKSLGIDFNQMMSHVRVGPHKSNIKLPQDLRPILYSAYNKRAKSIVLKKEDSPKVVQHVVVPSEPSPEKKE